MSTTLYPLPSSILDGGAGGASGFSENGEFDYYVSEG